MATPWTGQALKERDASTLSTDEIELVEKLTLRMTYQAVYDFAAESYREFMASPDDQQDIAEDVTREALDVLSGYGIPKRLYGNIDYKRARWIGTPTGVVPQALLVDSKAEKESATSITLQTSQLSMDVEFEHSRTGATVSGKAGLLPFLPLHPEREAITTVGLVHYSYSDIPGGGRRLNEIQVVAMPHGSLRRRYSPSLTDHIWMVGRNAPSRGEDFRVRLNIKRLRQKALWRVQKVVFDNGRPLGVWADVGGEYEVRPSVLPLPGAIAVEEA